MFAINFSLLNKKVFLVELRGVAAPEGLRQKRFQKRKGQAQEGFGEILQQTVWHLRRGRRDLAQAVRTSKCKKILEKRAKHLRIQTDVSSQSSAAAHLCDWSSYKHNSTELRNFSWQWKLRVLLIGSSSPSSTKLPPVSLTSRAPKVLIPAACPDRAP